MNRLTVYIGMAAIVLVNAVVFGFIFSNQSYAIQTGIQVVDNSKVPTKFLSHIYGDFATQLEKPMDVTKTDQYLYVTDTNNKRVQAFHLDGSPAFIFGESGTGEGQFSFPYGIDSDKDGKIYVADMYNSKISVHDANGEFIEYFAADVDKFQAPAGLRIQNDLVYITDIQANQVFVFNLSGNLLLEVGTNGSDEGQFIAPNAVEVDKDGNIYVVDTGNQRVQIFDADGNFVNTFNGAAIPGGDASIVNPRGIAITSNGTIYVVSNLTHLIHAFDKDGNELYKFGGLGEGPGQMYLPNGLYIDKDNTIYVTDTLNQRLSVFK